MGYADKRHLWQKTVGASISDNTNIASLIIPAGRSIWVFAMKSFTRTKSPTASAKIELCTSADAILASVAITQNNGTLAEDTTTTFPFEIKNTGTTDTFIELRTDQATGVGCDVDVEVHVQYPGT